MGAGGGRGGKDLGVPVLPEGQAQIPAEPGCGAQSNLATRAQSMPDPRCTLRLGSIAGGELSDGAHSNRVA